MPRWNGTRVFAYGEDTLACRLRASSTRSARGMRTQVLTNGQNTESKPRFAAIKNAPLEMRGAFFMAAELGFEPRHTESESAVLPLHNSAITFFLGKLRGSFDFALNYFTT